MPNGHIKCEDDQKYWCEHVQGVIIQSLDAESLWEEFTDNPAGIEIEVPMVPSSNLWARVTLQDAEQKYACRQVIWDSSVVPWLTGTLTGPSSRVDQPNFIGYLLPGEGRMVIRNMMFDWFKGLGEIGVTCSSSSHGYKEEREWIKAINNSVRKWGELWSVYTTGFCLDCNPTGGWSDDLIPENDKKASVW